MKLKEIQIKEMIKMKILKDIIREKRNNKNKFVYLKSYFMILNLLLALVSFSYLVSGNDIVIGDETNEDSVNDDNVVILDDGTSNPPNNEDIVDGGNPPAPPDSGNPQAPPDEGWGGVSDFFSGGLIQKAGTAITIGSAIGGMVGGAFGGTQEAVIAGTIAGTAGVLIITLLEPKLGPLAYILGAGIAGLIFLIMYKEKSIEIVEFQCLSWEAPIGGEDCEICNEFEECSEYTCKSLGQACDIINQGTIEQKCIWKNPHDVNSPTIQITEVTKGYKWVPDKSIRPPATGIVIHPLEGDCVAPFTPLRFDFITNEPAQCKIDYNLTTDFENMGYFVGGNNLFGYNHSEELTLPSPNSVNAVSLEIKNDGVYTLFIRCMDANGNFNQDAYSVNFCVDKGPDTTAPIIREVSIPSGMPIQFNQTELDIEIYINEPSECKWDNEDRSFENMENEMDCDTNVWEMNNEYVYTCRTNLKGIEDRKENQYYFRCKDQPWEEEGDRNSNSQSYLYKIIGTQPLNILKVLPIKNEKISGSTDYVPVFLEIKTDNGFKNGESTCYYHNSKPDNDEDYIEFSETKSNMHIQRQDLISGNYEYYFKCIDLGGNTVYNLTNFIVESDKKSPVIIRVYKESGELKIISDEEADCSYSNKDCNFEIKDGIIMDSFDSLSHNTVWNLNKNYYIRCQDSYENQPNPNICSIILRPSKLSSEGDFIEL